MNNDMPDEIRSDHFSLPLYQEILRKAIRLGYAFPTVSELRDGASQMDRFVLLRHDIDTSPRHALEMALLESRLGLRRTLCGCLQRRPDEERVLHFR